MITPALHSAHSRLGPAGFLGLFLLALVASCGPVEPVEPVADDPEQVIRRAGNSDDDQERHDLLSGLRESLASNDPLAANLDLLLPVTEAWAYGRERFWLPGDQERAGEGGYLGGFFVSQVWPEGVGTVYPPEVEPGSPLYPIWSLYRGRMRVWVALQNGLLVDDFFAEGQARLREAVDAFPENRVAAMYLGEALEWTPEDLVASPEATSGPWQDLPVWALAQHEALVRLHWILSWWVSQRQAPDGQFGGGWGDDVEMWRRWLPSLLAFDDSSLAGAWELLAEGVWALPRMSGGYSDTFTDVEHSAEDSADTVTPMLLLGRNPETWRPRAMQLAQLAREVWMDSSERGHLQFRSTYFTASDVDDSVGRACDTAYHTRALQPAFVLWQLLRREGPAAEDEAALEDLFVAWAEGWAELAEVESRGKPAGVLPSSRRFPSGEAGGPGDDWWNPGCHYSQATYRFPRALEPLTSVLATTAESTGRSDLLAPLESMAELRLSWLATGEEGDEGSSFWAGKKVGGRLVGPLARRRVHLDDQRFDALLEQDGGAYLRWLLFDDETALEAGMRGSAESLRINLPGWTSEVRFTDRLVSFASDYWNGALGMELAKFDPQLLYSTLTGDPDDPFYVPSPALRWGFDSRKLAARVSALQGAPLHADLVSFSDAPMVGEVKLLRLGAGVHSWTLHCGPDGTEALLEGTLNAVNGQATIELELPSAVLCRLVVAPIGP